MNRVDYDLAFAWPQAIPCLYDPADAFSAGWPHMEFFREDVDGNRVLDIVS